MDLEKAAEWYRKAAESGHAEAHFCYGNCCNFGEGVAVDRDEAAGWYRTSADQENALAECNLATRKATASHKTLKPPCSGTARPRSRAAGGPCATSAACTSAAPAWSATRGPP
mmetsp:Transcript_26017/g.87203  ORF Transcript_26017/g.87203 Transcript_26017/m.87203 type:complete len:113 (-) Transcript_26017:1280-1618(-)